MSRISARVRLAVLKRDHFACVAPVVDREAGGCRDRFMRPVYIVPVTDLELDHVRDQPMMGKTAESDPDHLVTLCHWHHQGLDAGRNWATSHRPLLREYLARLKATQISLTPPLGLIQDSPADEPSVRKREAHL